MKKIISKSMIAIITFGIIAFGLHTLYVNGNLPGDFYPKTEIKQPETTITPDIPSETETEEQTKKPVVQFKKPEINDTKLLFNHTIIPHDDGASFQTTETVTKDNNERIQAINVKYNIDNLIPIETRLNGDFISNIKLTTTGGYIPITNYTWNNALKIYLQAVNQYIQDNDTPIGIIFNFEYNEDIDMMPSYITMTIFTLNDNNVDIHISLYNYDNTHPVDYHKAAKYQ